MRLNSFSPPLNTDRPEAPPGCSGPLFRNHFPTSRKKKSLSLRSLNAAGSRLGLIKELLFTTKLCWSQVSPPQALLDCHLPGGRGCDIKQTQICQSHRPEHLLQPDTAAEPGRPAETHSTWQRVCVCVRKKNSPRRMQTYPHTADPHVDCTACVSVTSLWRHVCLIPRLWAIQTQSLQVKHSARWPQGQQADLRPDLTWLPDVLLTPPVPAVLHRPHSGGFETGTKSRQTFIILETDRVSNGLLTFKHAH